MQTQCPQGTVIEDPVDKQQPQALAKGPPTVASRAVRDGPIASFSASSSEPGFATKPTRCSFLSSPTKWSRGLRATSKKVMFPSCSKPTMRCGGAAKRTTGRNCQDMHRRGYPPKHCMYIRPPKSTEKAPARQRNKRGASSQDMEELHRSTRANFGSPSGARGNA